MAVSLLFQWTFATIVWPPRGDRKAMETVVSIGLGIGLSAACGFRVFVPLLAASILGVTGWMPLAVEGTGWIATWPALIVFATATVLETAGYFIPWLDHI